LFDKGVKADGLEVVPSYRPSTIIRKIKKGHPYDRVTLRDEGDFHRSFFIVYRDDEFEITADDYKKQYLDRKYSPAIYGLTPANVERLIGMIRDQFIGEAR
ncbi:hypothetical protein RZS08_44945, partial [Arthrospira platensis SPKY1]|nr:hypothetical protein [Arthrospira platensis SPKY1]